MHFADKLVRRISALDNPTALGLDPLPEHLPDFIVKKALKEHGLSFQAMAEAILRFNCGIIDAVADLVPAVKLRFAFYQAYGAEGLRAYQETLRYARGKGLLVIADAKLSECGSAARAYAQGHLGQVEIFGERLPGFCADAMTVLPYLGSEGILPFAQVCQDEGAGIFVVVRTANASADEIQSQPLGDHLMDEHVAMLVEGWGRDLIGESGFSSVGAVVGVAYPEEARRLRHLIPNQIFLATGYRSQGSSAKKVRACFYENGTGAVVSVCKPVLLAYQQSGQPAEAYADAAREAALRIKGELARMF